MSSRPYDEMTAADGGVRPTTGPSPTGSNGTDATRIAQKRDEAERAFHRVGITFAVYGDNGGTERLIPFDIVPRIIPANEWTMLERGLKQRARAQPLPRRRLSRAEDPEGGHDPADRVLGNAQYRREMAGDVDVPGGIYAHIAGVDIVRAGAASTTCSRTTCACRPACPYMLENRKMMMRLFPSCSRALDPPVQHYPDLLLGEPACGRPQGEEPWSRC